MSNSFGLGGHNATIIFRAFHVDGGHVRYTASSLPGWA